MRIFKNPHRLTDLCEYCEKLRDLKNTLQNRLRQLGFNQEIDDAIDLKQANDFIKNKLVEVGQQQGVLTEVSFMTRFFCEFHSKVILVLIFKLNKVQSDLSDYETLLFHKNVSKIQKQAFQNHLKLDNLKGKLLIELDYKQIIKLGLSPHQVTHEYYKQKKRSCLGI